MKKDSKKSAVEKVGALGGLFGHSITAVHRRLGKEGASTAHVRASMAAKGVKVNDTTVSIRVNAGRSANGDRGEPAPLTVAQVKELLTAAPDSAKQAGDKK